MAEIRVTPEWLAEAANDARQFRSYVSDTPLPVQHGDAYGSGDLGHALGEFRDHWSKGAHTLLENIDNLAKFLDLASQGFLKTDSSVAGGGGN